MKAKLFLSTLVSLILLGNQSVYAHAVEATHTHFSELAIGVSLFVLVAFLKFQRK